MNDSPQEEQTIGVVGAGQMGSGIGHVLAAAGYVVLLYDLDQGRLELAKQTISDNIDRQIKKGIVGERGKSEILARVQTTVNLSEFSTASYVIEAATEDRKVKEAVYRSLVPHLSAGAVIATNTSSLPILELAIASDRPDRFIGMHFFNPVPMMGLVEVVRSAKTSVATADRCMAIVARLGKTAALSADAPGFVVNRLLIPLINEAAFAVDQRVADVETVDLAMRLGASHPMGPLQLADLIGLDTCLAAMRVLHDGLGSDKYSPSPLLARLVEQGHVGRKSGSGFYDYSGLKPVARTNLVS